MSRDGGRLFVSNEDADSASIIDLAKGTVIANVKTGKEPEGVTVAPDGRTFWVTAETDHNITGIETLSGAVVGAVEVGSRPRAIAFVAGGSKAFVSNEAGGTVTVVDMAARKAVKTITMPEGSRPMGLAVAPDGTEGVRVQRSGRHRLGARRGDGLGPDHRQGWAPVPWVLGVTGDGEKLYTANGPGNDVSVLDAGTVQAGEDRAGGERAASERCREPATTAGKSPESRCRRFPAHRQTPACLSVDRKKSSRRSLHRRRHSASDRRRDSVRQIPMHRRHGNHRSSSKRTAPPRSRPCPCHLYRDWSGCPRAVQRDLQRYATGIESTGGRRASARSGVSDRTYDVVDQQRQDRQCRDKAVSRSHVCPLRVSVRRLLEAEDPHRATLAGVATEILHEVRWRSHIRRIGRFDVTRE